MMEIHQIMEPSGGGVHLSVAEARQAHFQHLAQRGYSHCSQGVPESWWVQYDGVAKAARAVETCDRDPTTKV